MSNLFNLLSAMCGKIKKPDLSQNDPEAADYVKGHTLDDAIALVADCGLVDISTDENGAILLDENNDILV